MRGSYRAQLPLFLSVTCALALILFECRAESSSLHSKEPRWGVSFPGEITFAAAGRPYYDDLVRGASNIRAGMVRFQASWENIEPNPPTASFPDSCSGTVKKDSTGLYHCFLWDNAEPGKTGFLGQIAAAKQYDLSFFVVVDPYINIERDTDLQSSWRCVEPVRLSLIECLPNTAEQKRQWYFFVESLVEELGDDVKYWQFFNEIDFTCVEDLTTTKNDCPDEYKREYMEIVPETYRRVRQVIQDKGHTGSKTLFALKKARKRYSLSKDPSASWIKDLLIAVNPHVDFFGYNSYPDTDNVTLEGWETSQEALFSDLKEFVERWNYVKSYNKFGGNIGSKFKWITEMGAAPSNKYQANQTDAHFNDHDFVIARNWYKYVLWLFEKKSKIGGEPPELVMWFRLSDKNGSLREGNKFNGFLYSAESWKDSQPANFGRKEFFIGSVNALWSRIADFQEITSLSGLPSTDDPDSLIQRFKVTLKNGHVLYLAWSESGSDKEFRSYDFLTGGDVSDKNPSETINRIELSLDKNSGIRNISFDEKSSEQTVSSSNKGFELYSDSNMHRGRLYIIERP